MPIPTVAVNDVGQAIQLALAPVFLLTGIAGMLNVMAGRLARIIDRGRYVEQQQAQDTRALAPAQLRELAVLEQRRHFASAAITACTLSALLVCMSIAVLFAEVLLSLELKALVALLFTGATLALVVGLGYFLREVHLATVTVRIASRPQAPAPDDV